MSYINIKQSICFIHIIRTGGTSISNWLEKNIGPNDLKISRNENFDKLCRYLIRNTKLNLTFQDKKLISNRIKFAKTGGHLSFESIAPLIYDKCPSIKIFTVIRDPFSIIKSIYYFNLNKGKFPNFKDKIPSLDEFVFARCSDPLVHDQASYIIDTTGNYSKNLTILKFEDLQENFNQYISQNFPGKLKNSKLPHLNKNKGINLELNTESKNLIKKRFKRDFRILSDFSKNNF